MKKYTLIAGSVCVALLLGIEGLASNFPETSPDKKSGEVFKNLKVLNNTPSDLLLPSMQFITSSLGVSCEYCHVENAFDKDDKKTKQTARKMMQMVKEINSQQFQGKQEITCYSCHRGNPTPLAIPLITDAPQRLSGQAISDVSQGSQNEISPTDVIAKYVNARGGASAIASLASLEEQGTFQADSLEFPIEVYETKSARIATVIHFPGSDRLTVFDGTSGSIALPGRPARAMTPGEADAARIDTALLFVANLSTIFSEIKVSGTSKVGTEDAVVLSGQRHGLPPVEMYFDASSGLLLRMVHYSQSPLGLNPTQTDYFDYRDSEGVKIPYHWTSATPTGHFSVQIQSARANVEIPGKVFSISTSQ